VTALHAFPQPVVERVIGAWESQHAGPTLVVVAGLHGNEWAGIAAVQQVLGKLEGLAPGAGRGRVVAIAGNLAALNSADPRARYIDRDLNRIFTDAEVESARRVPAHQREPEQNELLDLVDVLGDALRGRDGYLVDLHTTSAPSPPFIFVEDSLRARALATAVGVPIVLGVEEVLSGLLTDYVARHFNTVTAVLEGGQHNDPSSIAIHVAALQIIMGSVGITPAGALAPEAPTRATLAQASGPHAKRVYDVRHREPIEHPDFQIVAGLNGFDAIHHHESIVAVQNRRRVHAPVNGLLFMPNRQLIKRPGDDGFFIIRRVGPGWLWASRKLRRRGIMHRLLPLAAPGVRRHPDLPHALLVDPHYAPVFKREIFHLLGYRILRHGRELHLPLWRRALRGGVGVCAALAGMARSLARGGERRVLRGPSDRDWIVARRTLDLQRDPS